MNPLHAASAAPVRPSAPDAPTDRLRQTAVRLEGIFVEQLFKAMRETVPRDGAVDGGAGEELFTSMFDQKLADRAPEQWHRGLGTAIVKALRDRAAVTPPASPPASPPLTPLVTPLVTPPSTERPASARDPLTIPRFTTPERR